MIGIVDLKRAEADLAAGELACPECDGRLRRWDHARACDVRDQGPRRPAVLPPVSARACTSRELV
ncbi:MAG: hypothetical protein ACRD0H_05515, partial [Actinomycetes bacterium]